MHIYIYLNSNAYTTQKYIHITHVLKTKFLPSIIKAIYFKFVYPFRKCW